MQGTLLFCGNLSVCVCVCVYFEFKAHCFLFCNLFPKTHTCDLRRIIKRPAAVHGIGV